MKKKTVLQKVSDCIKQNKSLYAHILDVCRVIMKNMADRAVTCNSSGLPLVEPNSTSFPCPMCGTQIGRSPICRNQGVTYVCTGCEFTGP